MVESSRDVEDMMLGGDERQMRCKWAELMTRLVFQQYHKQVSGTVKLLPANLD